MNSSDSESLKDLSKNPEDILPLESRVKGWIKRLDEILKESEQIRRENDSSGKHEIFSGIRRKKILPSE